MNRLIVLFVLATVSNPAPSASMPGLQWLQGYWCSGQGEERIEELWLVPASGELLGINRTTNKGVMTGFEYLRIVEQDKMLTYIAQPGGSPPTPFQLAESGDQRIVFENLQHDFPQRIEYQRTGEKLRAQISGPGEDGEVMTIPFHFEACELRKDNM